MTHETVPLASRFELEAAVASGGMGAVFRARDRQTGDQVAIKVVHRGLDDGGRFEREAVLLAALGHPAIVRYVAHGRDEDGRPYLAMEWLVGEDLSKRIARGPLTVPETLALAARLSEGLATVHRAGLVHRDIKPDNIFLCGGDLAAAKLVDFGLVKPPRGRTLTVEGQIVGTPSYMAPEQIRGETLDPRVDVHALGAVLYECLAGRRCFAGPNHVAILTKVLVEPPPPLAEVRKEVPAKLAALIHAMLSKEPASRPADAGVVHAEIADLYRLGVEGATPGRSSRPSLSISPQSARAVLVVRMRALERDRTLPAWGTLAALFSARVHSQRPDGAVLVSEGAGPEDQVVTAARLGLDLVKSAGLVALLTLVPDVDEAAGALYARLKSLAPSLPDGVVAIDPLAESLLPSRFERRDAEGAPALGLSLVAAERDGLDLPRTVLGRVTPLTGRGAELRRLIGATAQALRGARGGALILLGESGMGASRLRQEALIGLRDATPAIPLRIVAASGDPRHHHQPLGVFSALFRAQCGLTGHGAEEDRRRLLARVAGVLAADKVPQVARFLGELCDVRFAEADPALFAARSDRSLMNERVRGAIVAYLRAEAERGPLLFVLENVHDADGATLELCTVLVEELAHLPFVLWCVGRPTAHERLAPLARHALDRIELAPLGPEAARGLVRAIVGREAPELAVQEILDRAAGAPLLLEEAARAYTLGAHEERARWDDGLNAMFEARLASLEPELGRVLSAAALMGMSFWIAPLCELCPDRTSQDLQGAVLELLRREWLLEHSYCRFAGEREFSFRSEAIQLAAVARLAPADRAAGHEIVARWLVRRGEKNAKILAEHFEAAGLHAVAGLHFLAAADRALSFEDLGGAQALCERALSGGADAETRGGLFAVLAETLRKSGATQSALEAAESALGELEAQGRPRSRRWFDAAGEAVTAASRLRKLPALAKLSDQLLEEARNLPVELTPSSAQIIATARAAILLEHAGASARADPLHAWLEQVAEQQELEPLARGRIDYARAWRALGRGDFDANRRALLEALASFELAGDQRTAAQLEANAGYASLELGEYDEAIRLCRAAIARAAVAHVVGGVPIAQNNLGLALGLCGHLEEGLRVEREAIAAFHRLGDGRLEAASRIYLVELLILHGHTTEAEAEARAAVAALETVPLLLPHALSALSAVQVATGRAGDAVVTARRAVAVMTAAGRSEGNAVHVWVRLALALEASAEVEGAKEAVRSAEQALDAAALKIENPLARARFRQQVRAHRALFELSARLEME